MRRWHRTSLISIALVGLAVLIIYWRVAPLYHGSRNTREIKVPGAVMMVDAKPRAPMVISTQEELADLLRPMKKEWQKNFPCYFGEKNDSGLDEFERSLQDFDYSKECLILIPVHFGDDNVGMSSPRLSSRKLTCEVWISARSLFKRHMIAGSRCFGLAVKRDAVDEVEVWIQGKLAATLTLE